MTPPGSPFLDLDLHLTRCGPSRAERIDALRDGVLAPRITAICGLPLRGDPPALLGRAASPPMVEALVRDSLAESALLTYLNGSNRTRDQLADLCIQREHFWSLKTFTLTVFFAGPAAERLQWAFARDRRFHLSWTEVAALGPSAFTALGDLPSWKKLLQHATDPAFAPRVRDGLARTQALMQAVLPLYFGAEQGHA